SSSTNAAPTTPAPITTTRGPTSPSPSRCQGQYCRGGTHPSVPPPTRSASLEPGVHLVGVGVHPLLRRRVIGHLGLDVAGHGVLVVVGPVEVLDQLYGGAAGIGEGHADNLVEVVRRIVALDGLRVGVAAGG